MPVFSCTLLADGSSDSVLMPLLRLLLPLHYPYEIELQFAEGLSAATSPLNRQLQRAVDAYPCDLLFVHRDAENESAQVRVQQIERAGNGAGIEQRLIPVVPVRMTEAWLLVDEAAIRAAARKPHGTTALGLPRLARIEDLPDPKQVLFSALRAASDLTGRRLAQFRPQAQRHRVADYMGLPSIERLRTLPSFAELEARLQAVFQT